MVEDLLLLEENWVVLLNNQQNYPSGAINLVIKEKNERFMCRTRNVGLKMVQVTELMSVLVAWQLP